MADFETVLKIVQDVTADLSLPEPSFVVGNTDPNVRQLARYLVKTATDCVKHDPPFAILQREYTFQTTQGEGEYDLPPDFQRMISDTVWDRNQYWQVRGSLSPQQWQVIKSGLVQTARISSNFRVKRSSSVAAKKFFLDPVAGEDNTELVFEYISNAFLETPEATVRSQLTADDDIVIFDAELMKMGIVWRWREARGHPYQTMMAEYMSNMDIETANDIPAPALSPTSVPYTLPVGNVPDSGFGA